MRILIANDDGYLAPGLAALVKACEGLGDLDVVAPEQNASGTSNSLTRTGWGDAHVQQQFWGKEKSAYRKVVQKAFKNYLDWWGSLTLPRLDSQSPGVLPGDFSATTA